MLNMLDPIVHGREKFVHI